MRMTQFRFCACAEEVLAKLRAAHAQCRLEAKGGVVSGRRRMRMTQFRFCACAETACPLGAGLRPRTYGLRGRPRKWGSFPARAARRRARGGAEPSPAAWKTFGPGRAAARWVSARPEGGRAGGRGPAGSGRRGGGGGRGMRRAGARPRRGAPGAGGGRAEAGGPARPGTGGAAGRSRLPGSDGGQRAPHGAAYFGLFFFCFFFFFFFCLSGLRRYLSEEARSGGGAAPVLAACGGLAGPGRGEGSARGDLPPPPPPPPLGCPGSRRSSARGFVFPPAAGLSRGSGLGLEAPCKSDGGIAAVHVVCLSTDRSCLLFCWGNSFG